MNKKDLIAKVCDTLQQNNIRKPVSIQSEKFTIVNGVGDSAIFTVDQKDKLMMYTAKDVSNILEAMIAVVEDCMRHGESICIKGFGSLELRKTKEHTVKEPDQDIWHTIPATYRAKFTAGCNLAAAARSYGLQEDDIGAEQFLPPPDEEE